jgi:hypothetical protein
MRTSQISLAVAGILAASAAGAANIDVYVSGASAQRSFWKADMAASVCGANPLTTYTVATTSVTTGAPDNEAYRCLAAPPSAITGVANGDQVTMHYSAELGSIYGISPFITGRPTTRLFVNPDSLDCSAPSGNASTCTISDYVTDTETFTSTNGTALVSVAPDVGVTDVEPKHWASAANWPGYTNVGAAAPTTAEITTAGTYKVMNGQLFSVIVNNASPIASLGTISSASMKALLTGVYDVWGDVPEVGGGNTTPIKLCRRDQGSGTQVSASIFFTGVECGRGSTGIVTQAAPGSITGGVVENASTGKVRSCVQGDAGGIGITSVGTSTNYVTLRLDGVQANAHNAAAGIYPFAFENFLLDKSASTQPSVPGVAGIVAKLVANAKKATTLPAVEGGSLLATNGVNGVAGTWYVAAPKSNFAIPATGFGNTKNVANWAVTSGAAVTALASRGGDNCKLLINSNSN